MTSVPAVGGGAAACGAPLVERARRPRATPTTAMPMIRKSQSPMRAIQSERAADVSGRRARRRLGPAVEVLGQRLDLVGARCRASAATSTPVRIASPSHGAAGTSSPRCGKATYSTTTAAPAEQRDDHVIARDGSTTDRATSAPPAAGVGQRRTPAASEISECGAGDSAVPPWHTDRRRRQARSSGVDGGADLVRDRRDRPAGAGSVLSTYTCTNAALGRRLRSSGSPWKQPDPVDHRRACRPCRRPRRRRPAPGSRSRGSSGTPTSATTPIAGSARMSTPVASLEVGVDRRCR